MTFTSIHVKATSSTRTPAATPAILLFSLLSGTVLRRFRAGATLGLAAHRAWAELRRLEKKLDAAEVACGRALPPCVAPGSDSGSTSMVCNERAESLSWLAKGGA